MRMSSQIGVSALILALVSVVAYSWLIPALSPAMADGGGGDANDLRRWMMGIVTIVILSAALFVILKKDQNEGAQKWAFGAVGTIMGFWLKQE